MFWEQKSVFRYNNYTLLVQTISEVNGNKNQAGKVVIDASILHSRRKFAKKKEKEDDIPEVQATVQL